MNPIQLLAISLTVLFAGLKLTNHIPDWTWWWVFSPVLGLIGLGLTLLAVSWVIDRIIRYFETPGQKAAREMRELCRLLERR